MDTRVATLFIDSKLVPNFLHLALPTLPYRRLDWTGLDSTRLCQVSIYLSMYVEQWRVDHQPDSARKLIQGLARYAIFPVLPCIVLFCVPYLPRYLSSDSSTYLTCVRV